MSDSRTGFDLVIVELLRVELQLIQRLGLDDHSVDNPEAAEADKGSIEERVVILDSCSAQPSSKVLVDNLIGSSLDQEVPSRNYKVYSANEFLHRTKV